MSSLIHKNIIPVVAIVVFDKSSQKYLIVRRAENQTGAGFWEFPGGKLEGSELATEALVREIDEELGLPVDPSKLQLLLTNQHEYPTKLIDISFYLYPVRVRPTLQLVDHDDSQWCATHELEKYKISEADLVVIDYLKKHHEFGL